MRIGNLPEKLRLHSVIPKILEGQSEMEILEIQHQWKIKFWVKDSNFLTMMISMVVLMLWWTNPSLIHLPLPSLLPARLRRQARPLIHMISLRSGRLPMLKIAIVSLLLQPITVILWWNLNHCHPTLQLINNMRAHPAWNFLFRPLHWISLCLWEMLERIECFLIKV